MNKFLRKEFEESLNINLIDNELYDIYNVKKGLRNSNGTGVLVGLTKIADVYGYKMENDKKIDDEGHLYYRGIDLYDLAKLDNNAYGFEKTCFLLLFGKLPNQEEEALFHNILAENYNLPFEFVENTILKNPSPNLMNHIQRAILSLYTYDHEADLCEPINILEKGISLLAKMPAIISYSLQSKTHYIDNDSLHIHHPRKDLSIAESILYLSRNNGEFTKEEADVLDLALIIHADHGGGNNSTFVNIVISSTGTDLYSAICGGLGSLKGPRHGGANKAVMDMMDKVISEIGLDATNDEMIDLINKILDKKFNDNSGLIYGIGHAVYTKSDPRAVLLRNKCEELIRSHHNSKYPNAEKTFNFYKRFEEFSIKELKRRKGESLNYCANLDFYSGLTYSLLNIPSDLYIPIFATARIIGWIAHNIENKLCCNKLIRPAAKYVGDIKK